MLNGVHLSPPRIISISFLITILIGAVLLHLPFSAKNGQGLSWIDAFFTATSATCVTGLTVVNTANDLTLFGQLVVMIMIQIGGLGLMTIATFVSILFGKKISFRGKLIMQEVLNQNSIAGLISLIRYILLFTIIVETLGAFLLTIKLYPLYKVKSIYYGFFHSISAFNNAGFDIFGNSLVDFKTDWFVNLVILGLFVGSGLGFTVVTEISEKGVNNILKYSLHSKMVLLITFILLFLGFLLILLIEFNNPYTLGNLSLSDKILVSLFQGATPRTAGFNTIPIENMYPTTLIILLLLMFIGASPASTGGGIKTTTFGVIITAIYTIIKGKDQVVVFERKIPIGIILKALAITSISLLIIITALMILTLTENISFLKLTFEVFSAFGTVGLSTGITPYLSSKGKVLIMILMFTGRIGPLTLFFALTKRKKKVGIGYPEERVLVG